MLNTRIFLNPLQLKGNAEQMNLGAKVDSVFFEAGNVTSNATALMEATRKAARKRNVRRTDSPVPTATA